ncbi:putative Beclin 1-associated autophagy-related key regulator [Hypsibius exemplaris]|uniref:Beclin 1-associated autophagy-related key regulator n=1 Tax=Hypsibius exemplaris TaxID=2072580 RepID=A0A1W0WQH3_HYPEX|nr:putative Beclin 1-associated autophagy-related key regulator [Hypsibius exemplaris]
MAVQVEPRSADITEELVAEALAELAGAHSVDASWICRSCASKATDFFCSDCVMNGNFTCSNVLSTGPRFSDLRLALLETNQKRLILGNDLLDLSQDLHATEDVARLIARKKWTTNCLKERLNALRTSNKAQNDAVNVTQEEVDSHTRRFQVLQQNFTKLKKDLFAQRELLNARRRDAHLMEIHIIKRRQSAIKQVTKDIFPLIELDVNLLPCRTNTGGGALAAEYCRVLEPILPLNGNYSAYHNYASQRREVPSEVNVRNPLYEVPAGLGMTAQLLHVLIQILDFQMPDLVEFGLFLAGDLDESSFQKAVYQLNWNILTLSSSQGLRVEDLPLKETLGNLLKLMKWKQLGRTGPYDLSNVLVFTEDEPSTHTSLQEAANDEQHPVLDVETLELDVGDDTDWESIPAASSSVLPSVNPQDQLTRSTFGQAVSGITAMFRSTMTSPENLDPKRPPKWGN